MHRVKVINQVWKQPHAKAPDRSACLVACLVLIKTKVWVAGGLPYIQAKRILPGAIVQQDDVHAVGCILLPGRGGLQGMSS